MTIEKAKMYKTAVVCSDLSNIPQGTYVAVEYLSGKGDRKLFRCRVDYSNAVEVLHEYELHRFVL